jgi:peptide/nickel transport system permease protein
MPQPLTNREFEVAVRIGRHLITMVLTVAIGAFLAATLVRFAPGFDADEQQLDSRLSHETVEALRAARGQNRNIVRFYIKYASAAVHGDLGQSQTLNRPVRQLVGDRLPVTARLVAWGVTLGWTLALVFALGGPLVRLSGFKWIGVACAGILLCIPSAVLALAFVMLRAPGFLAVALVVFPKIFSITRNLIDHSYELPHILTARAKGISELRVLLWHVLPVSGGQLIALAGVSISLAIGVSIPVEALCGIAGIGQLAWQAALGRDLPLLVTLTVIVTIITLSANMISDVVNESLKPRTA